MTEIRISLLRHFGIGGMKFFWDETLDEFKKDVVDGIKRNQMLFIIGEKGCGKNVLHEKAAECFAEDEAVFVNVRNYYKERLDISSIINACIYDLSDENPKMDLEARSRQFIKIVGQKHVSEKKLVSILINEGHRIHSNTYRALKELREATFCGRGPLFSVIVTGHPELTGKIESRSEVLWRSQMLCLNEEKKYYPIEQRVKYIKTVFGEAITNIAAKRIAAICKAPLEINFYVEKKMTEAKSAGKKVIDEEVIMPSNLELKNALGVSLKQIADEAGIGKTTVSDIVSNPTHPNSNIVKEALERLQEKKSGESVNFRRQSA